MQKKNKLKEMIYSLKIFQFQQADGHYFKMLSSRLQQDDVTDSLDQTDVVKPHCSDILEIEHLKYQNI